MKTEISNNQLRKKINKLISLNGSVVLVNKKAIIHNSSIISKKLNNSKITPVIKSEGYGVGAKLLANILYSCKYRNFFTANMSEAIKLRKIYKNINIYVLNCGNPINIILIKKFNLIPVLNDISEISIWAKIIGKEFPCVIHVDTGMNRLGISINDIENTKNHFYYSKIKIKFIMSHLACAEDRENKMNTIQLQKLKQAKLLLSNFTNTNLQASICNSSGIWLGKKYHMDFVRPGAAFLGLNPLKNITNPLKESLSLFAQVYQIREAEKGTSIGYGASYTLKKNSRLATISIGYAYGLSRLLSNIGNVYFGSKKIKILGKISMDLTVIDITRFKKEEIKVGTLVEIFGKNRSLENFAKTNNTISYEIICKMVRNIPKIII